MEPRFVGRAAELEELSGRLEAALDGRAGVALVAGEPGIGKTRLVAEFGRPAGARAVPVLWGACTDEDGAPAFWPWRRILRAWLATADAPSEAESLAPISPELADIARAHRDSRGLPATSRGLVAAGEARFALFDDAARFFTRLAGPTGLVLVIDDAQWADPASLALLAHVTREAQDARLLVAVTFRAGEMATDPVRRDVVAGLSRLPGAVHLELTGLGEAEVAAALTDRLGAVPAAEVVATVAHRTRGNPFFVGELGRVLSTDPGGTRVPAAVRDVVRRRLDRLPVPTRTQLYVLAVIGREPDLVLAAAVAGTGTDPLLDQLTPAVEDGLLERPPGRAGLWFGHDLVRETLLVELAPAERARIHQRVVDVLRPADADPDVLPELAHHALAALPLGDPAEASRWAAGAAGHAMLLVASGRAVEARRWYEGLPGPGSPRTPAFMALTMEAMRAQLAADLGDAATAETCHRLLLPHAELHAVGGAGAITTAGSVQLNLGIAALGAGRADAAVRHLRTAVTVDDAAGLAPFAAIARYRLAAALRARGRAADADEAVALCVAAGDVADRLGMRPLRAQVDALVAEQRDGGVLSRREAEIAELVGRGLTNRQIAATAHISERTVETHVQHVLAKLGFSGRSQIAAWVARRG